MIGISRFLPTRAPAWDNVQIKPDSNCQDPVEFGCRLAATGWLKIALYFIRHIIFPATDDMVRWAIFCFESRQPPSGYHFVAITTSLSVYVNNFAEHE